MNNEFDFSNINPSTKIIRLQTVYKRLFLFNSLFFIILNFFSIYFLLKTNQEIKTIEDSLNLIFPLLPYVSAWLILSSIRYLIKWRLTILIRDETIDILTRELKQKPNESFITECHNQIYSSLDVMLLGKTKGPLSKL